MRPKIPSFLRKLLMVSPILAVGLCFQNFSDLDVPEKIDLPKQENVRATSVEGAAEELLRREMPAINQFERKMNDKLQFRWGVSSSENPAEVQVGLIGGDASRGPASTDSMQLSLVNDKFRLDLTGLAVACDYTPTKDLLSVRTKTGAANQLVFEHSGRDQQSRVNWQMSW